MPYAGAYAAGWSLSVILSLVPLGLEIAALPGLFARKKSGWTILFYSMAASLVVGLVDAFTGNFTAIFGALIGAVIGFYVLFQIRTYYK